MNDLAPHSSATQSPAPAASPNSDFITDQNSDCSPPIPRVPTRPVFTYHQSDERSPTVQYYSEKYYTVDRELTRDTPVSTQFSYASSIKQRLSTIQHLALSPGGLVSDRLRKDAWSVLVGLNPKRTRTTKSGFLGILLT